MDGDGMGGEGADGGAEGEELSRLGALGADLAHTRLAALDMTRESFVGRTDKALQHAAGLVGVASGGVHKRIAAMDQRVVRLVLQYYATVESERNLLLKRLWEEEEKHAQEAGALQHTFYLSLIAHHLTRETGGRVKLRRVARDAPAFGRCQKAVLESMRGEGRGGAGGLLGGAQAEGTGMRVADICQIDNQWLAEKFSPWLAAAQQSQTTQVKGLFCHVPAASLERVVVFGAASPTPEQVSDLFWQAHRDGSAPEESYVRGLVRESRPLGVPTAFSRKCTPPGAAGAGGGGAEAHYVLLSRVFVGHVEVLEPGAPPPPELPPGRHSAFSPSGEEFFVYDGTQVFPEFLIQVEREPTWEHAQAPQLVPCSMGSMEDIDAEAERLLVKISEEMGACGADIEALQGGVLVRCVEAREGEVGRLRALLAEGEAVLEAERRHTARLREQRDRLA